MSDFYFVVMCAFIVYVGFLCEHSTWFNDMYKKVYEDLLMREPDELSMEERTFIMHVDRGVMYSRAAKRSRLHHRGTNYIERRGVRMVDGEGNLKAAPGRVAKIIALALTIGCSYTIYNISIFYKGILLVFVWIFTYMAIRSMILLREDIGVVIKRNVEV